MTEQSSASAQKAGLRFSEITFTSASRSVAEMIEHRASDSSRFGHRIGPLVPVTRAAGPETDADTQSTNEPARAQIGGTEIDTDALGEAEITGGGGGAAIPEITQLPRRRAGGTDKKLTDRCRQVPSSRAPLQRRKMSCRRINFLSPLGTTRPCKGRLKGISTARYFSSYQKYLHGAYKHS